jgi:hypothetical protein
VRKGSAFPKVRELFLAEATPPIPEAEPPIRKIGGR